MKMLLPLLACVCIPTQWTPAQTPESNISRKTIAVTVTDSARVEADVATIHLTASSYGATRESAYTNSLVRANRLLNALADAEVPNQNIETENVTISEADFREHPTWPKQEPFSASQEWSVRLPAAQARGIVDLAMQNGATEIGQVEWGVTDTAALESKARNAALIHARSVASEMVKGLGRNLGDLIYASNTVPVDEGGLHSIIMPAMSAKLARSENAELKLFPGKVTQFVTVYAIYAIN